MNTDQRLLQAIAKLYYEEGRTQSEIATQFSISRPKVSRKLAEARERGIVKIFIDDAIDDISEMEQQLLTAFHLKGARVASVPEDDVELAIQLTARLGAQFLPTFLDPGDHLGVTWGWTLVELSKEFPAFALPDCSLVQLSGAVDNANCRSFAHEIISNLSQKLGAESAFCLPCPALVESPIILDILLHDAKVRSLLERVEACNKLFVNIATPDEDSCLYQAGYLNDENIARLKDVGPLAVSAAVSLTKTAISAILSSISARSASHRTPLKTPSVCWHALSAARKPVRFTTPSRPAGSTSWSPTR